MAEVLTGARARINVAPPPVATGGFLAAANVIDVGDGAHELMGAQYITNACTGPNNGWTGKWCVTPIASQCEDPGAPPADPKQFDPYNEVVDGDPFVAYAGTECDLGTMADNLAAATAAFNFGERRNVDEAMAAWLDAQGVDQEVSGSAVCVLGEMEAFLAASYGGRGLIAVPVAVAIPLAAEGAIYPDTADAGNLVTALGTPVAAYATPGLGGPYKAYASGQLTLLRGPLHTYNVPPMVRKDGTCAPARALAERVYVPLVECVVGEFTMNCCPCPAGGTP